MVLTRFLPQSSPVLVIDLAVTFYQAKVEAVPHEGTWPPQGGFLAILCLGIGIHVVVAEEIQAADLA